MGVKKMKLITIAGIFMLVFGISSTMNTLLAQAKENTTGGAALNPQYNKSYVPGEESIPSVGANPSINS